MAEIQKTAFRTCLFSESKLMGLHFEDCNEFLFAGTFDNCNIDFASFYKWNLTDSMFRHCSFKEADFTEANLSGVDLRNCNFGNANFENTNLENADLRSVDNLILDPEINKVNGLKISAECMEGLLLKYNLDIS